MANVGSSKQRQHQQQQLERRWSVGRSSTPRSNFSRHSSEAFYASVEPLSGSGGRALHNGNGGGPDPDSPYSALDSCGVPAEARSIRQQYRTSARPSQDASERELFYTLPRNLTVSRKEILRRRSVKDEAERHLGPAEREPTRRPTTLPSIGRRARLREADTERASSLLKKVSRQDILRRRASIETSPQLRTVARTSFTDDPQKSSSRSTKEDRDLSRPSTLPKTTLHASGTPRLEEYVSWRTRETGGREAPIYGRIRRRKMSLPTGAATLRDPASSSNTLTRFSKTRTSGEHAEKTTKVIRHLRDPVSDSLDRSRYSGNAGGEDIYAKVTRKVTRQVTSQSREEKQPESSIDRTMSRRRIISNANQMDSLERRMHQDRDQDVVKIRHDAILVSKADMERLHNFKAGKTDVEKASGRIDSTDYSTRRDSTRTDSSWLSRDKCLRKDSTWTNERQARCRPKSQSSLLTQTESVKTTMRPTTLPSYVKLSRKTSTGSAARDEQKPASNSGLLTKRSKERSNYVKKTATRIPIHVRALSDANSARSNSPETSSSIFGFCTGKRKVQASPMTRSFPSWNLKTV